MKNFLLLLFAFISINAFGQSKEKEIIYSTSSVEVNRIYRRNGKV